MQDMMSARSLYRRHAGMILPREGFDYLCKILNWHETLVFQYVLSNIYLGIHRFNLKFQVYWHKVYKKSLFSFLCA